MLSIKNTIIISTILFAIGCKADPAFNLSELNKVTEKKFDTIESQKMYDVHREPGLENIIIASKSGEKYLIIGKKKNNEPELLKSIQIKGDKVIKTVFVRSGLGYSMVMIIQRGEKDTLNLYSADNFSQTIEIPEDKLSKVYLRKNDNKGQDESIIIDEIEYRFNGFEFAAEDIEAPLPILTSFKFNTEESWLIFENRGAYTSRAILTLGFPELRNTDKNSLVITKDIPTVKIYRTGQIVHKKGGGTTSLGYPIIEVVKEPYASGASIKLPVKIPENAGKIRVRMAYTQSGNISYWPQNSLLTELDTQGYPSYEIEIAK
ncbi:MAG: hypothetical protein KDK41_04925 [Leptospiraceae bacterium]|nr:hypothetical protein [Leptospiraceae bacterium]